MIKMGNDISEQLEELGWIVIFSREDFDRHTAKAKEDLCDDDEWVDSMPESFPCLASGKMVYNGGSYLAGWQFIEMKFAVHLSGFAKLCVFCNFGRMAMSVESGETKCTHCERVDD